MAMIRFSKLRDYEIKLGQLGDASRDICGKAIHEGAKIIADEVKNNLNSLNVTTDVLAMLKAKNGEPTYITQRAK